MKTIILILGTLCALLFASTTTTVLAQQDTASSVTTVSTIPLPDGSSIITQSNDLDSLITWRNIIRQKQLEIFSTSEERAQNRIDSLEEVIFLAYEEISVTLNEGKEQGYALSYILLVYHMVDAFGFMVLSFILGVVLTWEVLPQIINDKPKIINHKPKKG
ncbi:hypothetical protein H6771_02820 [Candidatus Peribacteria bacterium]|nr:hypothetical protein [Candidatus Peribacteria bacterium]